MLLVSPAWAEEHPTVAEETTEAQQPALEENTELLPEPELLENEKEHFTTHANLQILNKITAKTERKTVKIGETIRISTLDITPTTCWKAPPYEDPENKILLEIWEEIPSEPRKQLFYGWMFSSSPSLSALEHPIYDITLIDCVSEKQ